MEGCEYKSFKDIGGKDFRLMLVDRAVNGWDEYRGTGTNTKERFVTSSIQNLLNAPAALKHGTDRFEWIAVDDEHNIARNCVHEGIDKEPSEVGDYCLSRPFWGYSKEIWDTLYGAATSWQERWYQKIVWTNLCKMCRARAEIRVKRGGRCSGKLAPSCSVPRLCSLIRRIFCS